MRYLAIALLFVATLSGCEDSEKPKEFIMEGDIFTYENSTYSVSSITCSKNLNCDGEKCFVLTDCSVGVDSIMLSLDIVK